MPRSFLLKRFARPVQWIEEEKNVSLPAKEEHEYQCNDANSNNMSYHPDSPKVWDVRPALTNTILTVGKEWSHHNQVVNIDKPNHNDFLHQMIYRDHASQLNNVQSSKQANKRESNKKQTYKCHQCGKVFKTKYTLTIHLKMPSHTGARPFVCAICGKGFRLSSTLCRHKIIHTSHKPHRCQTCGKAFNRSSTLKTHQRTHSDTKEFACDICGKGFHQKGNLRNHLLIHSGEKPYKCSLCKRAFNKLSNLKFHMHVHTDNKPYRCRFCKNSFPRRCELKEHIVACSKNNGDRPSVDADTTSYLGTSN